MSLLYHHCMPLSGVKFGEIVPSPMYIEWPEFLDAFKWLEKEVGFYPLFMAVGCDEQDIEMTGYYRNWQRKLNSNSGNYLLFSFEDLGGVFMDYDYWHIVLNAPNNNKVTEYTRRLVLKPSWPKSRWLKMALERPGYIQMTVPSLDLRDAERIWTRNRETKSALEEIGFKNVEVRRVKVPKFD